jgi:hypothetical protein
LAVALRTIGRNVKSERIAFIKVAVNIDPKKIILLQGKISPHILDANTVLSDTIAANSADVEKLRIVEDANFRLIAWRSALNGVLLEKTIVQRCRPPCLFREDAVNSHRCSNAIGRDFRRYFGRKKCLLRKKSIAKGAQNQEKQEAEQEILHAETE